MDEAYHKVSTASPALGTQEIHPKDSLADIFQSGTDVDLSTSVGTSVVSTREDEVTMSDPSDKDEQYGQGSDDTNFTAHGPIGTRDNRMDLDERLDSASSDVGSQYSGPVRNVRRPAKMVKITARGKRLGLDDELDADLYGLRRSGRARVEPKRSAVSAVKPFVMNAHIVLDRV